MSHKRYVQVINITISRVACKLFVLRLAQFCGISTSFFFETLLAFDFTDQFI